jgi:Integral membrane protein CcmA involved in cell shape determination
VVNFIVVNLKKTNDIISYFGPNTRMEGEIHSNGSIHIEGSHNGSLMCNGDLIIGENSKIKGQATAKNIIISGYFEGELEATNNLEILSTGHVKGTSKAAN